MRKLLSIAICVILFYSCTTDENSVSNKSILQEKFNGKYELLSATSEKAVDLNNDGIASTQLLTENSMILFSIVEIRIPQEDELFLEDNEFVFSELWPTENDLRLKNKDVITVYNTKHYNWNYDLYGNTLIGEFTDDLKSGAFLNDIDDDGKNTLIELKSIVFLEADKVEVTVVRKLYTMSGWTTTKITSLYQKYPLLARACSSCSVKQ